ncbi:MAG: hypothetical protein ACRENJ_00125, partial [Candidatus Eiseniibacteriota bacterium]
MDDLAGLLATATSSSEIAQILERHLRARAAIPADLPAAALEVVRLAERLAEHMDAERRAERELAIARDVQGKLLPQSVPRLRTLELAARCIQARS